VSSCYRLDVHKGMSFHIFGIMIGVKMGIFICVFPLRMAEYMLGDGGSGYAIELCCGGMSEEVGVQVFLDGKTVGG